jgi:acetyltransferase-like isoleucine patch superfamily enzyme
MSIKIINNGGIIHSSVIITGIGSLTINKGCEIRANTVLEFGNGNLILGHNTVLGYGTFIQVTGNVTFGNGVLVGPHTCILSTTHTSLLSTPIYTQPLIKGSVIIGDDVWIGANCTIGYNTVLHKSCILGANSFLNKSIPTKEVWGGLPAKKIKDRS